MRDRWFELSDGNGVDAPSNDAAPQAEAASPISVEPERPEEQRLALLIGNAAYPSAALANPVRDVRLLAWTLEGMGFSVRRVENASLATMQDAVIAFGEALDAAGTNAIALLYFAGHGVQYEGGNFLLPVDARIPAPNYLATRSLPLDVAVAQLARSTRRATIVAVDACRDDVRGTGSEAAGVTAGLARAKLPRPSQLVFSTAAHARADDGWGQHSPFALALSEELPSLLAPGRRLQDMIDDVATKVGLWTKDEQTVAVYREGFMPPLSLTTEDERRLRDWSKRPPFRLSARQAMQRAAAGISVLAVIAAAALWWTSYPETRTTLLLRAGLLDKAAYDFTCAAPWDAPADRYGLTRRDWCQSVPKDLAAKLVGHVDATERVASGLRAGDPKAVLLSAALAALDADRLEGGAQETRSREAYALAERSARTDLPLGAIAPFLLAPSIYTAETGPTAIAGSMRKAATEGVLVAAILAPVAEASLSTGGIGGLSPEALEEVEAAFRRAAAEDSTGEVAYYAAQNFSGNGLSPILFSPERERVWLLRSVAAGYAPAVALVLKRAETDPAYRLEQGERERLIGLLASRNDAAGRYWQARQRIGREHRIGPETLALASAAAEAGFEPATLDLAEYYLGDGSDPGRALALLRAAAKAGQAEAILRLGLLLANGRTDRDGRPLVSPEPQEAMSLLERPEVAKNLRGAFALAQLYLYGDLTKRDPSRAQALLRGLAAATPEPRIGLDVRGELDRIETQAALQRTLDPTLAISAGRPDAPLSLTLAIPPACAECGLDSIMRTIEPFLASGDARLAIVPLRNPGSEADIEAALLAICAPSDSRAALFRRLVAGAPQWRDVADARERALAFGELLKPELLDGIDLTKCLSDGPARAALQRQREDLASATRLGTPPVIFIGGERRDEADALPAGELRRLILAQLPPATRVGIAAESVRTP
jgi:TPR repeat protein